MEGGTVLVLCCIGTIECTKVSGLMTIAKEKEWNAILTEINMKETSSEERHMVREFTIGSTAKFTMANGAMGSKKATECGAEYSVIPTSASGRIAKLLIMACINGRMVIVTKAVGSTALSMVKVQIFLPMATYTQVTMHLARPRAEAFTNGKTAVFTKVSSKRALSTVMVNGEKSQILQNAIATKVCTVTTRKMGRVSSPGKQATYTTETTLTTSGRATARYTGRTARFTRASG